MGNLYVAAPVAIGSGPTGRLYSGISVFAPSANGNVAAGASGNVAPLGLVSSIAFFTPGSSVAVQ